MITIERVFSRATPSREFGGLAERWWRESVAAPPGRAFRARFHGFRSPVWLPATALLGALLASPSPATGQVRITNILGPDSLPREATREVQVVRWGTLAGEPVVVEMDLRNGDELRAAGDGGTTIEMTCGDRVPFVVHGALRVAIRTTEPPCVMDVASGGVYAVGNTGTQLNVGGVEMRAVRTVYSVLAGRGADGPLRRLAVFEGTVAVHGIEADEEILVESRQVLYAEREPRWDRVTESDIVPAAALFARLDEARIPPAVRESPGLYDELYQLHRRVLEDPENAGSRLDLIRTQVQYNATSETTLYHIDRTRALHPATVDDAIDAAALGTVASLQMDRPIRAAEYARLMEDAPQREWSRALGEYGLDAAVVDRLLQTAAPPSDREVTRAELDTAAVGTAVRSARRGPQIAERDLPESLQVELRAEPARAAPGQPVRIIATVRTAAGRPLEGTRVTITTDGGAFRETLELHAAGLTDRSGVFAATWQCRRCDPTHEFRARVARRGYVGAEAIVRIAIRGSAAPARVPPDDK